MREILACSASLENRHAGAKLSQRRDSFLLTFYQFHFSPLCCNIQIINTEDLHRIMTMKIDHFANTEIVVNVNCVFGSLVFTANEHI